ncbi:MAG: hypothetical protein M1820_005722 [Bogoriella megaspora]|nr:MAG: hypothetical protein M1820_005722 [Bogoriella megaspora]
MADNNLPIRPTEFKKSTICMAPLLLQFRVWRSMIMQLFERRKTVLQPQDLFLPLITRSAWTPLLEIDYNMHKSNSTYFSDLDVSRAQLMLCLLRTGIERLARGEETQMARETEQSGAAAKYGVTNHVAEARKGGGKYHIALGGVSCHFKKEIAAYSGYEIWTRVLSWDRKWIYLISHIVKRGTVKPSAYVLQSRWGGSKVNDQGRKFNESERITQKERWKKNIYATSVAKYVVKRGRITIPPELVLERSRLLPRRPQERKEVDISNARLDSESSADQSIISVDTIKSVQDSVDLSSAVDNEEQSNKQPPAATDSNLRSHAEEDKFWDWEACESKRLTGLKLAEIFGGLDALHDEFDGNADGVLGSYADLFW